MPSLFEYRGGTYGDECQFIQGEKTVRGECPMPMGVQSCVISEFMNSDPRSVTW